MRQKDAHLQQLIEQGIPFAICRIPNSTAEQHFMGDASLDQDGSFIMEAFDPEKHPTISLQPAADLFQEEISDTGHQILSHPTPHSIDRSEHQQLVTEALDAIRNDRLDKVIVSRIQKTALKAGYYHLYSTLSSTYLNAFVYLCFHPHSGIWCGASPEVLISGEDGRYSTMALAGTRPAGSTGGWGDKEQNEHAVVRTFIERTLREEQCSDIQTHPLETVQAGKVEHLRNKITFTWQRSPLNLARALSPTPAVCGFPKDVAKDWIATNETHDRAYYCGFLGVLGTERSAFFVNLRCMQLLNEHAYLYLGGGITAGSDPEMEWKETVLKAQTLLGVIENL